MELARILGLPWRTAGALNDLGSGCLRQGRYAEAIDYLRSALPLSPGSQRGRLQGVIETNLGTAHIGLGNYEQALFHAERGLILRRQAGDRQGEIYSMVEVARAWQGMGMHPEVIALCEHALSIEPNHAYPPNTAAILDTLGLSLRHTGDVTAMACWCEALEIFDRFGDPRADELRARLDALGE